MRLVRWILVSIAALFLAPASAGAVTTFGANLSVAPNVEFGCEVNPDYPYLSTGAETCTWWTTGRINDTSEGDIVPYGGGTIVAARVRVGKFTGPMQFVVIRSLRHPESTAEPGCCFPVGNSEVFTPAPDSITTVPMNVPVRNGLDPATGIENYDTLALSVLAPGVPVPAYDTGERSLSAPAGGGFYPVYVPGTERSTGLYAVVGFQTLFNADLEPTPEELVTPVGPTDPVGLGNLARVRKGKAFVPLTCNLPQGCAGLLRLQSRPLAGGGARVGAVAARKARKVTYGKLRFKLAFGKRKTLRVRLNKAGKRLMRKHKRVRTYANVSLSTKQKASKRLTLRR